MTGFDFNIDRDIGLIKVTYRSDDKERFKNKSTSECFDILIGVLKGMSSLINMVKRFKE